MCSSGRRTAALSALCHSSLPIRNTLFPTPSPGLANQFHLTAAAWILCFFYSNNFTILRSFLTALYRKCECSRENVIGFSSFLHFALKEKQKPHCAGKMSMPKFGWSRACTTMAYNNLLIILRTGRYCMWMFVQAFSSIWFSTSRMQTTPADYPVYFQLPEVPKVEAYRQGSRLFENAKRQV